jgi:nucleoside-diphosphate-sugar epimerase
MKIFLTGGTGFIGSHFLKHALESGHEVLALKRAIHSVPKINLQVQPNWLIKEMENVTSNDLSGIDVIVHLAAHSANVPYDNLENCIKYNVLHPLQLFKAAKDAGVNKFVVAGTCFEYGRSGELHKFIPTDAVLEPAQTYPASKAMSSIAFYQFAIENAIKLSYLRIFQVFGEGESESRLWPSLRKSAMNGSDFPMTYGAQVRDFIEVGEVAKRFIYEAVNIAKIDILIPRYYNVGSGTEQSILEFSKFWWKEWNAKGKLLVGEIPYRENEIMRYVPKI